MSPELGFLLFLALLWGPTALWLVFRAIRGHRGRLPTPFDRSQLTPEELDAPVGSDGFWACGTCRSLNRGGANRCYRCQTAKGSAGGQAPGELPAGPGIPVMAEGIARPSGELPVATTVALATRGNGPPAPEVLVGASERTSSAVPPEAPADVPVCPFLGFRDDPATRNDFPDPGNRCQLDLFSQPIGVEHQKSYCLTAAHQRCARYPAGRGGHDEPTVGREGAPSA